MTSTSESLARSVNILLVEDSPSDADLTKEALDKEVWNCLHHVEDGEQAMAFLRREEPFDNAVRPDLVLLDLNMPRKNGLQVLEDIHADENLNQIPVIVLTTSDDEHDVAAAYGLNANCFITKPVSMPRFYDAMAALKLFWFHFVTFPPKL